MTARVLAEDWSYRYPGRAQPALRGASFAVEPGQLVVLMGPSGSGKSTLLAALAGVLPPEGAVGRLEVTAEVGPAGQPRHSTVGASAAGTGLVQQEPEGNLVMEAVGDDVAFPLESAAVPPERIWSRVRAALDAVGLDVALDRSTSALSGGQQQALAVAAATVAEPGLVLLDEPTANLDPDSAGRVLAAVEAVRAAIGCTVVVIEHRVEPWLARADRVLLVDDGSLVDLARDELAGHLAARPDLARRVWVDHEHLAPRGSAAPVGPVVLAARGVAVAGRLAALDLDLRSGEVVALTGPPGAGKSTMLACVAGLLTPTTGAVEVRAEAGDPSSAGPARDPWRWPSARVAATFGVVFQNPEHQFLTGRVIDELTHGLAAGQHRATGPADPLPGASPGSPDLRARAMLARLGLSPVADANPFTLSGGEQRRLSVATALVAAPPILLLDEPTFGQDPATWAELVDIVAGHRDSGGAVLMATHDPDLVRVLAARELRLGEDRLRPGTEGAGPGIGSASSPGAGRATRPGAGLGAGLGAGSAASEGVGPAISPAAGPAASPGAGPALLTAPTGLRRLDPLALLGAATLLSMAALLSTSIALNLSLAGFALLVALLGGVPARRVALLGAPALLASASVALSNALLGSGGLTSAESWASAALPASRVLAVALPGLIAALAIDPTALADALVARAHVPARAAYSVLAALRLLPLLGQEWTILGRASRARGLSGTGVGARAREFGSMTFRLLVAALRRGGQLATALDARGLRAGTPRTIARPVRGSWRDPIALGLGVAAVVAALATRR